MPFIRLSDNFTDHPKFTALSDGAFRLWIEVLAYSRRYETDGAVPMATVKTMRAYAASRVSELLKPWKAGEHPLWRTESDGIEIHDYLEWNHSKAENDERRGQDAARKRRTRAGVHIVSVADTHRTAIGSPSVRPASVPDMDMDLDQKEKGEPIDTPAAVRERRVQPRRLGRGVFAGALPSDHADHAACSPNFSWCVPNVVHNTLVGKLAPQHQGDRSQAHARLLEWYPTVWASLAPDTVIANDFQFWRAKATEAFSRQPAKADPGVRVVPGVEATAKLVASMLD